MNKPLSTAIVKSPLKWAGGKRKLVATIQKNIPKRGINRLVEPFVGGGSVFLNTSYSELLLIDSNPDLIHLFTCVQQQYDAFVSQATDMFVPANNDETKYYELRKEFNNTDMCLRRAVLFLYLNRHGYNGLCRYNQKGEYNVPFGRYKKPYFPSNELNILSHRTRDANMQCGDFSLAFSQAKVGDVIYCDPPYMPIDKTSSFTAYSGKVFSTQDQLRLADLAFEAKNKGVTTIISNNYLPETLAIYSEADAIKSMKVARTISCKGSIRKPIKELIAIYKA